MSRGRQEKIHRAKGWETHPFAVSPKSLLLEILRNRTEVSAGEKEMAIWY